MEPGKGLKKSAAPPASELTLAFPGCRTGFNACRVVTLFLKKRCIRLIHSRVAGSFPGKTYQRIKKAGNAFCIPGFA